MDASFDRFLLGFSRHIVVVAVLSLLAGAGPVAAEPDRPTGQLPDWWVTLRITPSPSQDAVAMTIPVELIELHPRSPQEAATVANLMPPASTDPMTPSDYTWDYSHGFGQLMPKGSKIPCRVFALRPERSVAPLVDATIRSVAPALARDDTFKAGMANLGVAIMGYKSDDLAAVFPELPLSASPTKLGEHLEAKYSRAFKVALTANSTFNLERTEEVLAGALAARMSGPDPFTGAVDQSKEALRALLAFGQGNADEKNLKKGVFRINLPVGAIPHADGPILDLTGNVSSSTSRDDDYEVRLYPFGNMEGIVDYDGWALPAEGSPKIQIDCSVLPTSNQAVLYATVLRLMLNGWRWKEILTRDNYTRGNLGYPLTQTLLRINEPLWEYLTAGSVLSLMGPRRKRWADDPVKLLDPVSAAVWLGRLDRFEMMVRGPGTSAALFIGAEAGLSKDSFFPCAGSIIDLKADLAILDAIVGTEQNSMGQSASDMDYWVRGGFFAQKAKVGRAWAKLWGKQDDASEATRQIEAHDQGTADRLRAARNRAMIPRVVDLLAAGFTRPERPVPLKATLAASFPGTSQVRGGYQGADPKIEPDLVWLVRAMSAGDGSPLAGGLARPLAQLDGTELAKFVKGLVENEKVVAITWDPPPDATEASRFARLGPGSSQKMRSLFTYGRVKYKPTDPSQRVVAEAASRGWQADWYDDWSRSVAAQAPTTDGDRATYDFLQMDDKLEKQLAKLTDDVGYVFFDSATVEGLKLPDGAAPAPVAKAIAEAAGLNFSMIARFEPPDKVADAKKSYLEASILQDLKAGNQLLSEYWKAQAADSDAALSGSRWKEDLRALVRATGAKATLVKSQGDPEVLQ